MRLMMLDDGDYIVIGKLIPGGDMPREKDIQRCYVSFTYVMIGTYTHAHHVHTRTQRDRGRERKRKRELWEKTRTHARGQHICSCK